MARLDAILSHLRQSLWFLPTVLAVTAVAAAALLMEVDRGLSADGASIPFLFGGGADGAREVLSTIATSMLTFTGLVFTVTMLVLSDPSSPTTSRWQPRRSPSPAETRSRYYAGSARCSKTCWPWRRPSGSRRCG